MAEDEAEARRAAAAYARRVRRRTGLTQVAFAKPASASPSIPSATGSRASVPPPGPARVRCRAIIDRAPEAALAALE